MYLKSLMLSGFKSFGKTTTFEFPASVTAVVGPNGSGKSNVAEAIRWVLGEQSMKTLRGKRGEDLIFNGSDNAARLGRAEVKLVFDNSKKQFPYEFDEVVISRRVVRDGTNEYLLNGSSVRLKDIFELLSKVGLGATQHHIISQGEVDRILWASIAQRQEMIEEALGLKEYHLKIRDASRKLDETEVNMKEVEARRRELAPHLKYLKTQAEKMQAFEVFRTELDEKAKEYAQKESQALHRIQQDIAHKREPLASEQKTRQSAIRELQSRISSTEKAFSGSSDNAAPTSNELTHLREREQAINRELGRLEGAIAASVQKTEGVEVAPAMVVMEIDSVLSLIEEVLGKDSMDALRSGLRDIKSHLYRFKDTISGEGKKSGSSDLEKKKTELTEELKRIQKTLKDLQSETQQRSHDREKMMVDLREHERALREEERTLEKINQELRELVFEQERFSARSAELKSFISDLKVEAGESKEEFSDEQERVTLMRAIERLRIKLEEAGGIDSSIVKEYEDTKARTEFLAKEVDDLTNARKSLVELTKELEMKLEEEFSEGVKKINAEFGVFFKNIFGGGKASLSFIKPKKTEEGEVIEGGVDIALDIPRKRLRSLDMLSGGERALTSVALLFAMSAVNPPPFLVLDETDAALDEANSQRYGDLLAELSKKAQLIVITHNRGTMQRAGILYGVTLGSDGISRILSLKFEDAQQYAKEG